LAKCMPRAARVGTSGTPQPLTVLPVLPAKWDRQSPTKEGTPLENGRGRQAGVQRPSRFAGIAPPVCLRLRRCSSGVHMWYNGRWPGRRPQPASIVPVETAYHFRFDGGYPLEGSRRRTDARY